MVHLQNNPWFYCVGAVAIFFSLRTFWVLKNLPAKPKVLANGKRSVW
ncbi:hypothetical protein L248_2954 [Schleiferilactobacillus shenzhenensis LY-73]|uniref:Uncharacterized protein n=1 Tax=Schleiferilactobacillus shenzhenensis LY-73 TaxID=1231336 RepID=U4TM45_9LACO|nr:hypothetical protein L248_2954 [Schleiferilactobacillus shenzhenensis LY-73]